MNRFSSALSLLAISATTLMTVACGEAPPGTPEPGASGGNGPVGSGGGTPGSGGSTPGSGGGTPGSGGGGMDPSDACGSGTQPFTIRANESTNMALSSTLTLNPTVAAGSDVSLTFDWSAVDTDLFGHPIDWNEIVMASLVVWTVDSNTIANLINTDDPNLMDFVVIPAQLPLDATRKSAVITEFKDAGGAELSEALLLDDYLNPAKGYTYTFILQDEFNAGVGSRMIHAFTLEAGNPTTLVPVTNDSTDLEASAVFGQSIQVPAGVPNLTIDWFTTIAMRSYGGEFKSENITQVLVGQYDPALDLQMGILDLETAYKNLYTGKVEYPEPFDLSTLKNDAGATFPGIDGTDQWYVGLMCSECTNPSPWYLAKLTPCP